MPKIGAGVFYKRILKAVSAPYPPFAAAVGVAGRVHLVPISVPWPVIVDRIGYQVAGTSAGNVILGVYREGATADSPVGAALVVETASTPQAAATSVQLISVSDTLLVPGQYFLAAEFDDATATFYRDYDIAKLWGWYYARAGGYGALTDPCPALTAVGMGIIMMLRVKTNLPLGQQM